MDHIDNRDTGKASETWEILSHFRKAHGLNCIQTASILGVSKQSISYWDSTNGKKVPRWIPLMLWMTVEYCELNKLSVVSEAKTRLSNLKTMDANRREQGKLSVEEKKRFKEKEIEALLKFMKKFELSKLQLSILLCISKAEVKQWLKGRRAVPKWASKITYLLHVVRKKSNKNIPHSGHWSKASIGWSKWSIREKYYFTNSKDIFIKRISSISSRKYVEVWK